MANPFRRMFFDIENSYMICKGIWFLGEQRILPQNVVSYGRIICISYRWQGDKKVHRLSWEKGCDKAMMKTFYNEVLSADELVGHNGDNHDIKWIRTRFLMAGFKSFPDIKSIDTLKTARSKFKFPSNKLDEIARYIEQESGVDLGRKLTHSGLEMWDDVILRNSKKSLTLMQKYCDQDVVLLENVYNFMSGYIVPKTHIAVALGGEKWDCPHCASERTMISTTKFSKVGTVWTQMKCNACKRFFSVSEAVRRGYLEFKLKQERRKHNL